MTENKLPQQESASGCDSKADFTSEVGNLVFNRAAHIRNSALAFQIEKFLPGVTNIEKKTSLPSVLRQVSEKSLSKITKLHKNETNQITFKLPRKSLQTAEITLEEFVIAGKQEKLLTNSFVRNLPVPMQDKRIYRYVFKENMPSLQFILSFVLLLKLPENLLKFYISASEAAQKRKSISLSLKRKPWYTELFDFASSKYKNIEFHFDFWHETLKIIEGQHGTAIVAYFIFIRWLLYLNIIIFLLHFFFLVMPQCIFSKDEKFSINHIAPYIAHNISRYLKEMTHNLNEEYSQKEIYFWPLEYFVENITNASSVDAVISYCQLLYSQQITNNSLKGVFASIQDLLQGTGPLESTYLFLGFYPPYVIAPTGYIYNISLACLCIIIITFIICLVMMIDFSSVGIQEAFLAYNKRCNYYSNEVFSAWDYCIDKPTSAQQQHYRFVLEMKTNLLEDRCAKEITTRSTKTWANLYAIRLAINSFIIIWVMSCYYLIYSVTVFQMSELQKQNLDKSGFRTFFIQFLSSITVIILNSISPIVFSLLAPYEKYHAQTTTNISLFRNLFLYLSSIMVLLNTFYQQTACKPKDICGAGLDDNCRSPRCWETYIGQQLFKLSLTDMFVYIGVFLGSDTVQHFIIQNFDNKFTRQWGHQQFFLPTEVLAPVNSQTILWLGVFYSPLLPTVMILKLVIIFYIKKTKVLKYCDPSEHSYRASRFNAVFMVILLISFFAVLIFQCFAIESIPPSRGCGPFRHLDFMTKDVPTFLRSWLSILMSHWTFIISTILLCITIHYYWGVLISQKELANRLRAHLVLQSQDKQFLLKKIADLTNENSSGI